MAEVRSYRDLLVWQKSMTLVSMIYQLTQHYPRDERFGLTNQTRRSAVSVPSNIAEGYGRYSPTDYSRFLKIATGSLYELQTQLEIARNLRYLEETVFRKVINDCIEISKMLRSMNEKINPGLK